MRAISNVHAGRRFPTPALQFGDANITPHDCHRIIVDRSQYYVPSVAWRAHPLSPFPPRNDKEAADLLKQMNKDLEEEIARIQKKLKESEDECASLKKEVTVGEEMSRKRLIRSGFYASFRNNAKQCKPMFADNARFCSFLSK